MIRLVDNESGVVGEGRHRSGWPYALRCLEPIISSEGILFDDFVESSFAGRTATSPHQEPWVGVFHLPHDTPGFLTFKNRGLVNILKSPMFKASLPHLKLGVTLSSPLAAWLEKSLGVPFVTLLHPSETPETGFSEAAFLANRKRRIIQIGWHLRNTSAIYQLKAPDGYTKTSLHFDIRAVHEYRNHVTDLWGKYNWFNQWDHKKVDRLPSGIVENSGRVSNEVYDRLLSENVVFIEFFVTAANNAVIECIARNTPLVVNRLPALEEYLGKDYPLFYERIEDATGLFSVDRILEGHAYLKSMDKRPFTGEYFRSRLSDELTSRGLC